MRVLTYLFQSGAVILMISAVLLLVASLSVQDYGRAAFDVALFAANAGIFLWNRRIRKRLRFRAKHV